MQRLRTRRLLPALALLGAAGLLASCSESIKDEGAGTETTAADKTAEPTTRTTRGITDTEIRLGGIQYGVYFGDAAVGVEARLKEANDAGGVHGRQLTFIGAKENNNDPTKDVDLARSLVEQDEVFALIPVMSGTFGAVDYLKQNNVPFFGYGVTPAFCDNTVAFGVTGCVTNPSLKVGSNALGTVLKEYFDGDSNKTVAFIGEDNDAGRGGIKLLKASVEDKGFKVVAEDASVPAPPEQPGDVSPFVNSLMTSNDGKAPDVVYLQTTLVGTKIADGLQKAGFKGAIITPSYSPLLLGSPGYNDILVNTQFDMDPTVALNAKMLESVAAVKPDAKPSLALVAGYYSADMFIKALEATGQDLTVELFLKTLNDGFKYSAEGVVGESTWPDNHTKPVPCAALAAVKDNQFEYIQPLVCGNNIEIE